LRFAEAATAMSAGPVVAWTSGTETAAASVQQSRRGS
jgi:hypothetical protein